MVKDMESAQKSNTCDFLTYGKKLTSQSNKCACKQQRGVCLQLSHQGRLECWYHTAGKERTNLWPLFLAVYSQAFLVSIIKRRIHFRPVILVLRSCPNGQRHTCSQWPYAGHSQHSVCIRKVLEKNPGVHTVQPKMEQSHCGDRCGTNGQTGQQRKQVHTLSPRMLPE